MAGHFESVLLTEARLHGVIGTEATQDKELRVPRLERKSTPWLFEATVTIAPI